MHSGHRTSRKQDANRPIIPMARSVAPKSSAPASEVIAPASKAATTSRPSTGANPNNSGLHSVGIGALCKSSRIRCSTTLLIDSQPRFTQSCEKNALDVYRESAEQANLGANHAHPQIETERNGTDHVQARRTYYHRQARSGAR